MNVNEQNTSQYHDFVQSMNKHSIESTPVTVTTKKHFTLRHQLRKIMSQPEDLEFGCVDKLLKG